MLKRSRLSLSWLAIAVASAGYFTVYAARVQESAAAAPRLAQAAAPAAARPAAAPAAAQTPVTAASQRALLDQYCVTCHNEQRKVGGLALDTVSTERLGDAPAVWEKVAHMLRAGAMPPAKMPRPDPATSLRLASWLEDSLDTLAMAAPHAGRLPLRRLNRTEYTNAIRDLLGVEVPVTMLPADGSLLGFDNIAGVLSVSPLLLERYMSVARQVSRVAVGDPTMVVAPVTYTIDGMLRQDDRNEDLPFGSRGVTLRHSFPLDGDYIVQVRLRRNGSEYIRGLGRQPQPLEVRVDGARIKVFEEAGLMKGTPPVEGYTQDDLGDPEWEKNSLEGDAGLEVRFQAKAGMRTLAVALPARRWAPDSDVKLPIGADEEEGRDGNIQVATVSISGPYEAKPPVDSMSRRKVFTCTPASAADEETCATTILSTIARRAYRRPLDDGDVQTLMRFCRAGATRGFDGCIQSGLQRIIASPHFLFRVEGVPAAQAAAAPARPAADETVRLSDTELASRLSFFLWSSIPDDELLDLAFAGKLKAPGVFEQQVKRMLADPRSKSLVDNFAAQWLELRRLEGAAPVAAVFPEFDGELRDAFKQETERFLESMIREDRPVVELLTASYTFVNERLARHYGIPNIAGSHFRRVSLTGDKRVGLLGHGSILTVTSQANRTSPVLRGKWVLDNVLGAPVPPPPPDIPALKPDSEDGEPLTGRAALEQHRNNVVCANCHARMDPWGFALENYDAIGAWRDEEGGTPLNVSDQLLDGTTMTGPAGVRQVLLTRKDEFVRTVSEKLLVYALGRPLEYYDRPALRKIIRDSAQNEHRWSSVILGVATSVPFQFQMRGAE
jgi:mono/diheme cytochrome c family protein